MSIDIQKQIKDNATDVNEYFQDLLRWEEEEHKREGRRERIRSGNVPGKAVGSTAVPPPRGKASLESSPSDTKAAQKQLGGGDDSKQSSAEEKPIQRDTQPMTQYYSTWDQFDADAEADRLDEVVKAEQRKEQEVRQAEKDRKADELAFNQQNGDRYRTSNARPLVKVRVKASGRRPSPLDLAIPKKEEANRYFAEGRFREAIATYTAGLEFLEKYQPKAAAQAGIPPEAANTADGNGDTEAIAMKVALLSNRAASALKLEEWRAVVEDATEALRFDPAHEKSILRRGMAFIKLKRWAAAAKDLEQALTADPSLKKAEAELQMARRMMSSQLQEARGHAQAVMCDTTREPKLPTRRLTVAVKGRGFAPAARVSHREQAQPSKEAKEVKVVTEVEKEVKEVKKEESPAPAIKEVKPEPQSAPQTSYFDAFD